MRKKSINLAIVSSTNETVGGNYSAELMFIEMLSELILPGDKLVIITKKRENFNLKSKGEIKFADIGKFDRKRRAFSFSAIFNINFKIFNYYFKFQYKRTENLEKYLLKENINLVLSPTVYSELINFRKIPYIVCIWDTGHLEFPELPELGHNGIFEGRDDFYSAVIAKSFYTIVDSEKGAQNLITYYRKNSQRVSILNLIPKVSSNQEFQIKDFAFYPAQFWAHKNHKVLLDALKYNKDRGIKNRKLVLCGFDYGNLEYIKETMKELHLQDVVEIREFLERTELIQTFCSAGITLMPSILGPTNIPPLEALSYGCPVACSNAENFPKEFSKYMIRIDPFDVEGWARVLSLEIIHDRVDKLDFNRNLKIVIENNHSEIKKILSTFRKQLELFSR